MEGQLDSELATSSPDLAKVFQLKCSLKEKVDTLKLLDDKVINYTEDEAALIDEVEQSNDFKAAVYAAIIRAEKGYPGVPSTLPKMA